MAIYIKNEEEINNIRKSCKMLAELFLELDSFIKEGISTKDIDDFSYEFIIRRKAKPAYLNFEGFPATACVSLNDEVIHGIPSQKRILQNGDLVKVDLGINLNGYFSDCTHCYEIGDVPKRVHELNTVTRKALYRAIEAASEEGARINDIGRAVFDTVSPYKYGIVRDYCGHGVGIAVHEEPSVFNYPIAEYNQRLKKGMVIAIEPMITLGKGAVKVLANKWTVVTRDKSIACHWEHTIAITENGVEILSEI